MKLVRRLAGYSPWAIAVAMALECANPAAATTPTFVNSGRMVVVDQSAGPNVMVAWLADPGLFHCHLTARSTAEGLELAGFVSNEFVHQKAVNIAKAVSSANVVDRIKVQHGMPVSLTTAASPEELAPQASTLLAAALGEKVLGLKVSCPRDGHVELVGHLPSAEDKFRASKCLQQLSGCTHVVNRVSSVGSPESAATVTGLPLMTSMPPQSESQQPVTVTMSPLAKSQPTPTLPRPTKAPTHPVMAAQGPKGTIPAPALTMTESPYARPNGNRSQDFANTEVVSKSERAAGRAMVTSGDFAAPPSAPISNPKIEMPPAEVTKATSISMPEIRNRPIDEPKTMEVMPDGPAAVTMKPIDAPKRFELSPSGELQAPKRHELLPEMPKPASARISDMPTAPKPVMVKVPEPEAPKPIIVPPLVEAPKPVEALVEAPKPGKAMVSSPYGGQPKSVVAPPLEVTRAEAPKLTPISAPPVIINDSGPSLDIVKTEAPVPKMAPAKAGVSDMVKAAPPIETPKTAPVKAERYTAATAPVEAPVLKPVTYASSTPKSSAPLAAVIEPGKPGDGSMITGIIRQTGKDAGGITLDGETARRAVEDACRGVGFDSKVTANANRQLSVALKVVSQADWDRLYAKIKALPELNGYSVIYNVQVAGAQSKTMTAVSTHTPSRAPLMGVIRGGGAVSVGPEIAKSAVEKLCAGCAEDVSIRATNGKQLAVSMKVKTTGDWDKLYGKIKDQPEVAGYSVIYNVSVK